MLISHIVGRRGAYVRSSEIRLEKGFAYLAAIVDWYSRYVLSWRLSNTLDADFCVEALQEAIGIYGVPDIFNSDQGPQFTCKEFNNVLTSHDIRISMDGRGRCHDNIFVERLWHTVKYENVYLSGYRTIPEARTGLAYYLKFYNMERYHQTFNYDTPWKVYSDSLAVSAREKITKQHIPWGDNAYQDLDNSMLWGGR